MISRPFGVAESSARPGTILESRQRNPIHIATCRRSTRVHVLANGRPRVSASGAIGYNFVYEEGIAVLRQSAFTFSFGLVKTSSLHYSKEL